MRGSWVTAAIALQSPKYLPHDHCVAACDIAGQLSHHTLLLNTIKEELFAIETEKLSGTLSATEYAEVKVGLEALLKRALKG
jgi:hypothetical protein